MTVDPGTSDQRDIDSLLRHLDHPVPVVAVRDIVARAEPRPHRWRLAAGVLLALAIAGGAYALPGSPLRRWVKLAGERRVRAEVSPPAPLPQAPAVPAGAGVAVNPGRSLVIRFSAAEPRSEARVGLVDSALVVVRSSSSGVTFTSDLDRLQIENSGAAGSFTILIPRSAPRVEIRVGDTRVFLKEGARVDTRGIWQSDTTWLVPLRASSSF